MSRGASTRPGRVRRALVAAFAIGVAVSHVTAARACGYDNPEAYALGTLNWAYPNALYVRTAVWQAEDAGLLPPRGQAQVLGPLAYYRAAGVMKRFGAKLADARLAEAGATLAVVIIPEVMWTRYEIGREGVNARSHAVGPAGGDVVVVTSEKVVRALLDGRLNAAMAEDHGLLRFYGGESGIASMRTVMAGATEPEPAGPSPALDAGANIQGHN